MRKGDGKTVGWIVGEQFANLPIGCGGRGTIKVVGKGLDDANDAGKPAGKTPTYPEFIEHVIGGDFNDRSQKVTGGQVSSAWKYAAHISFMPLITLPK